MNRKAKLWQRIRRQERIKDGGDSERELGNDTSKLYLGYYFKNTLSCLYLFMFSPHLFMSCPHLFMSCLHLFMFCAHIFMSCPFLFQTDSYCGTTILSRRGVCILKVKTSIRYEEAPQTTHTPTQYSHKPQTRQLNTNTNPRRDSSIQIQNTHNNSI
jgi:hypothetical protein